MELRHKMPSRWIKWFFGNLPPIPEAPIRSRDRRPPAARADHSRSPAAKKEQLPSAGQFSEEHILMGEVLVAGEVCAGAGGRAVSK
jgi:hypothetical protein